MRAICRSTRRPIASASTAGSARAGAAPAARRAAEIEVAAPKTERADQRLARARGALARGGELGGGLGVKNLLARVIELVGGAGLGEAFGELCGGAARRPRPGPGSAIVSRAATARYQARRASLRPAASPAPPELRLAEAPPAISERAGKVASARISVTMRRSISSSPEPEIRQQREARVGRQACLHHAGLGNGELIVGRLQAAVVEKRDLHNRVGGERGAEQARGAGVSLARQILAAQLDNIALQLGRDDPVHQRHATVRREGRAAAASRARAKAPAARPQSACEKRVGSL